MGFKGKWTVSVAIRSRLVRHYTNNTRVAAKNSNYVASDTSSVATIDRGPTLMDLAACRNCELHLKSRDKRSEQGMEQPNEG